jgi:hypothetical protein
VADRVLLHVGTPKSGTTYLQTLMWENQRRLRSEGVLLPGRKRFDHNRVSMAIREADLGPDTQRRAVAAWQRIRREIADWDGIAVISNEWLTLASPEQAREAVRSLAPAEVEIVVTARDPVAQAPAAWQEALKIGGGLSLPEFLDSLDAPSGRWTWHCLDPAEVSSRWAHAIGAGRVHVVTVPPRAQGSDLLWRRFAQVLGVCADGYQSTEVQANESLGAESAAFLQRISPDLLGVVESHSSHWSEPARWIRTRLSHELLVPLEGHSIGLRPSERDALRARSQATVTALRDGGYLVVGDLADLSSTAPQPDALHPDDVTEADLLRIAERLTVAVFDRWLAAEGPQINQARQER